MQTETRLRRDDLRIEDLLSLAKNSMERWLIKQAFQRGQEKAKQEHAEEKSF
jgi:hypothetical protein